MEVKLLFISVERVHAKHAVTVWDFGSISVFVLNDTETEKALSSWPVAGHS